MLLRKKYKIKSVKRKKYKISKNIITTEKYKNILYCIKSSELDDRFAFLKKFLVRKSHGKLDRKIMETNKKYVNELIYNNIKRTELFFKKIKSGKYKDIYKANEEFLYDLKFGGNVEFVGDPIKKEIVFKYTFIHPINGTKELESVNNTQNKIKKVFWEIINFHDVLRTFIISEMNFSIEATERVVVIKHKYESDETIIHTKLKILLEALDLFLDTLNISTTFYSNIKNIMSRFSWTRAKLKNENKNIF